MSGYPRAIVPVGHVEPVPRRIRALLGGRTVVDTTDAMYVWEHSRYPRYYIPVADCDQALVGDRAQPAGSMSGYVRFAWDAFDAWFEEDEQVFVHPRDPYVRVDALRSSRQVRIELAGVELASSISPVLVFETALPTRYYLPRTDVRLDLLVGSDTESACPYKGVTSGYWSARVGDALHTDLAWSYDFPTRQLLPITGLIAFFNEKVDVFLGGELQPRPKTHYS